MSDGCSTSSAFAKLGVVEQALFYTNSSVYCGTEWRSFWLKYYVKVDFSLTTTIALIGIVTNVVNILVFSQKDIRKSPLMRILLALAVADLLQSVRQLAESIVLLFVGKNYRYGTLNGTYGTLVLMIISIDALYIFHSWTVYLTLVAALWRWIGILRPLKSRKWLTNRMAKRIIILNIVWATVVASSARLNGSIQPVSPNPNPNSNSNVTFLSMTTDESQGDCDLMNVIQNYNNSVILVYKELFPHIFNPEIQSQSIKLIEPKSKWAGQDQSQILYKYVVNDTGVAIFFIINAVFMKLGPCFLLLIFTIGLIVALVNQRRDRQNLFGKHSQRSTSSLTDSIDSYASACSSETSISISLSPSISTLSQDVKTPQEIFNKERSQSQSQGAAGDESNRITLMLVVTLLIFFVTEIPAGISMVPTLLYGKLHFYECTLWITPFRSMLELSSSATSFFVYIGMGKSFRGVLFKILLKTNSLTSVLTSSITS